MSTNNFSPKLWANEINENLEKDLVLSQSPIVNFDYEGEFSAKGQSVQINQIGDVAAKTYTGTVTYDDIDDAATTLIIDTEDYFAVKYPDLDRAQNSPKLMGSIARKGAYALNDNVDQAIAAVFVNGGINDAAIGTVATSVALTSSNAETYFTNCFRLLSEGNVRRNGRWVAVAPWIIQRINQQLITDLTDNVGEVRNGFAGRAWGFDFFESNNIVDDGTDWQIGFGVSDAITLARQISLVEGFRDHDSIGDLIRGYNVYGKKVVQPNSLGFGVVKKS